MTFAQILPPSQNVLPVFDPDGDCDADGEQQDEFKKGRIEFHELIGYDWAKKVRSLPHHPDPIELSITSTGITLPSL